MDAAGHLTGDEKPGNGGFTARVYLQSAVLVVQCGVDKHRLSRDIYVISLVDNIFAGAFLLNGTLTGQNINHRRVQPDAEITG